MPEPDIDYVFGYGSLVELREPVTIDGRVYHPVLGRLRGFYRHWGAAMNNWEATELEKHFVDPETGEKPKIRVAYLDIERRPSSSVNGLALPVDAKRLADLDVREVNYIRIDVTEAFEPSVDGRVFTYTGTAAARERSRAEDDVAAGYVSRDYVAAIRAAFAALGDGALVEFDRTTEPLQFPERHLELRYPPPSVGESG